MAYAYGLLARLYQQHELAEANAYTMLYACLLISKGILCDDTRMFERMSLKAAHASGCNMKRMIVNVCILLDFDLILSKEDLLLYKCVDFTELGLPNAM